MNSDDKDAFRAAADRMLRVAAATERVAKSAEELSVQQVTTLYEIRGELRAVNERLAKMETLVGIVERETTGAHRLVPIDVGDSDKSIERIERRLWRRLTERASVRIVALLGGGGMLGSAVHWLIDHLKKR